jgi:spore coat polysaccharide biosynthesis protein SpsF (cytidylyltransferase family)
LANRRILIAAMELRLTPFRRSTGDGKVEPMTTVAILQARMTSSRLPGKVLADLGGATALELELDRLQRSAVDTIVVATTRNAADDPVADLARRKGVGLFRGDEQDVLGRYVEAAREAKADVVVRVTGDCPLLDPDVVDRVVAALGADADYAANVLVRTFPVGLDVEAIRADVLEEIGRVAESPDAREHVTWYVREERPELFERRSVEDVVDNSDLRWTLDTPEDLARLRRLVEELDLVRAPLPYAEVVARVRERPELAR